MPNFWPGSPRERTQINKIRNEEEETATDTAEIQNHNRILQLYTDKLEAVNKFLETHSSPKLNQEETHNLNRLITRTEIEYEGKKTKQKQKTNYKLKSRIRRLHRQTIPNT